MVTTEEPLSSPAALSSTATPHDAFELTLELGEDYAQRATFDIAGAAPLLLDEPAPLGAGSGPNPARVLGAAVGACLGDSLAFCLRKAHVNVLRIRTTVRGVVVRNERGRLRIGRLDVTLEPEVPADQRARIPRCLGVFEDYCIVTASIRAAVPVEVTVTPVFVSGAGTMGARLLRDTA
jgi:organic hydroperoxide reductase OsmC/OhrA